MKKTQLYLFLMLFCCSALFIGCSAKNSQSNDPNRIEPGSAEFYLNEGIFYLNTGNMELAEKRLLKALKKKPTLVDAINGLGVVYLQKREFKKAAEYFNNVIRINPMHFDAYNYLGVVYTELGEYNLAKENLLVAANADKYRTPENALANLANLEIKEGRIESALRYVEKGMEKNKRFPLLHNLMGIIMERQEKFTEALQWYEKAQSLLTEEEPSYLVNIGRVYARLGQKGKALDTLEKALSKAYSPELKQQIRQLIAAVEKQ